MTLPHMKIPFVSALLALTCSQRDYDKTLADGTTSLKSGERLKLRHRFLFHTGDEKSAKIAEAFADYAKEKK